MDRERRLRESIMLDAMVDYVDARVKLMYKCDVIDKKPSQVDLKMIVETVLRDERIWNEIDRTILEQT